MKRLLTIGHSYVVGLNRRLAHEMAVGGGGRLECHRRGACEYPGDLRSITLEPFPERPRISCRSERVPPACRT